MAVDLDLKIKFVVIKFIKWFAAGILRDQLPLFLQALHVWPTLQEVSNLTVFEVHNL